MQAGERVAEASCGALILFLVADPNSCNSAVLLYSGLNVSSCNETQPNSVATGVRVVVRCLT